MSESSGGTSSVCKYCGATLPTAIASFCGNCGKPQQEIKSCIRCNFSLPAKAVFCFECGQNQSEQLQRKPCMLCQTVLPINAQHCIFCSAPQDFGILRTLNLKNCNNPQCLVLMMPELQICYKCRAPQQVMPVVHNQSQQSGESVPLSPQSGVGTFLGIQQTQSPEVLIQTATPLPSVTPPMNPPLHQSALQLSPIASLTDNEKEQYSTTFAHTTTTNSPHYSPSLMDAEEDPSQKLDTSPITSHTTPTSSEPVTPQKALLSSPIKRSSDSNDYAPEGKKKETDKNTSVGTCEGTNVFKEKGGAVVHQKLSDTNNETNDSGVPEPLKDPTNEICGDESNNERSQIPSDDVTDHEMPKSNEKIIPNQNLSTPDSVNTVPHPDNNQAPIRQSVGQEKDTSSVPSGQENTQAHAHTDVLNREKAEAQRKFIKEKISESYVTSEEHGIMTDEERTETQDQNLERKRKQEKTEGDLIPSSKIIKNSESVNSYTPDPPDNPPSDPPDTPPSDPPDTPPSDPQNTPPSDPPDNPPSDPPDNPPSDPPDTPPSAPPDNPPSDPPDNPPSDPPDTPPSAPPDNPPSDPSDTPPSAPPDTPPSAPPDTPPSDPPPSAPPDNPPSDPPDTPPSAPPDNPPSDPPDTPPSAPPDNPPSDPPDTPPSAPPDNPPSDPPDTPPSAPPDNPPSDPPDTPPSAPPDNPPPDPQNTPPSDSPDTPPSDPPPSDPSPPPDPNISGKREQVPDPLSTPEIDPQTNHQVTQTPEDNVDPKDPNSSTFIAQASDSDSSPMPSPNKQDLKTPVQEVNDTNELHLGPNTTASQTSEVEKHNDEKKTKEIKMKTGDEQKKEKQNSTVQPTNVKDDQGNTSTVDKGKEKRGQKKEMK